MTPNADAADVPDVAQLQAALARSLACVQRLDSENVALRERVHTLEVEATLHAWELLLAQLQAGDPTAVEALRTTLAAALRTVADDVERGPWRHSPVACSVATRLLSCCYRLTNHP